MLLPVIELLPNACSTGNNRYKGPIDFEGYIHDENTDVESEQSCTRDLRGTVGNRRETHTHTAMREGLEQPRERLRTSTPLTQPKQRGEERTAHEEELWIERRRAKDCREEEEKTGEPPTYQCLSRNAQRIGRLPQTYDISVWRHGKLSS